MCDADGRRRCAGQGGEDLGGDSKRVRRGQTTRGPSGDAERPPWACWMTLGIVRGGQSVPWSPKGGGPGVDARSGWPGCRQGKETAPFCFTGVGDSRGEFCPWIEGPLAEMSWGEALQAAEGGN